jgi:methylglutaconyl-CoA hydratase
MLEIERKSHVVTVAFNRPEKRNALNIETLEELSTLLDFLYEDSDVRVLILKGNGKAFCSGLDLKEAKDLEKAHHSASLVAKNLEKLYFAPFTTIAYVHGAATAGGAGMMSACDLAFAEEGTLIGYLETKRGLVAGLVMSFLLQQVSLRQAKYLLLTGSMIDATQAVSIGLVNEVISKEEGVKYIDSVVKELLQAGPEAIKKTKNLLRSFHPIDIKKNLQHALDIHIEQRISNEAEEGFNAFLEKRQPSWDLT